MPAMTKRKPDPWPKPAGWLTTANSTALQRAIVLRALNDVGIQERPPGSNRGLRIDRYLRRANVPESLIRSGRGYWCAAALGAWWIDAGSRVPVDYANCDAWIPFLRPDPCHGAAIVFGSIKAGRIDAVHIELVARLDGIVETIGGNKSLGAASSNEGVCVDIHAIGRRDVLGYVHPAPA